PPTDSPLAPLAPVLDAAAPVTDSVAPWLDIPAPPTDSPLAALAPVLDTAAPVTGTVAPALDIPAPPTDSPLAPLAPVLDTAGPVTDTVTAPVSPAVGTIAPAIERTLAAAGPIAPFSAPTAGLVLSPAGGSRAADSIRLAPRNVMAAPPVSGVEHIALASVAAATVTQTAFAMSAATSPIADTASRASRLATPDTPFPMGPAQGSGAAAPSGLMFGGVAAFLILLALTAPALRRRLSMDPACFRPVPFISLSERPG
ncbi:MAG: hypothetical protein ACJ76V_15250, partial [Thermoleophilaceae bacterium]